MNYLQFLITVNSLSVILLVMLALMLIHAVRFRKGHGYMAAAIVVSSVPVYMYNVCCMSGWSGLAFLLYPLAYSVDAMFLPLLWIFVNYSFGRSYRLLHWKNLFHFLPMLVLFGLSLMMPVEERMQMFVWGMSGEVGSLLGNLNAVVVTVQFVLYNAFIFRFIRKARRRVGDTMSDAEWVGKVYVARFLSLYGLCFLIAMVLYVVCPRVDAWLMQVLDILSMIYLVHHVIVYPTMGAPLMPLASLIGEEKVVDEVVVEEPQPHVEVVTEPVTILPDEMQAVCDRAVRYLSETKAYLRPDISLAVFAKEANIPQRTLSRSINGHLHCNFFTFINGMRVEEAKRCLLTLETSGFNIDSVYSECGFRSRSTFFMVFKKIEGKSPAVWLEEAKR